MLQLPASRGSKRLKLRCWSTASYDHGSWDDYPSRVGFHARSAEEWHQMFRQRSPILRYLLQTWMFWGGMEALTRQQINVSDYVVTDEMGRRWIEFERVLNLYKRPSDARKVNFPQNLILIHEKMSGAADRTEQQKSLYILLAQALTREAPGSQLKTLAEDQSPCPECEKPESVKAVRLLDFMIFHQRPDIRSDAVTFSIDLMIELISHPFLSTENLPISDTCLFWGSERWFRRRMKAQGWCPTEISVMLKTLSVAGRLFMSALSRPHVERDHYAELPHDAATLNAQRCRPSSCFYGSIDESAYDRPHFNCSGCKKSQTKGSDLDTILESGEVPVIVATDDIQEYITLLPSSAVHGYVAISHVWLDGYGNVDDTAMHSCQFDRISQYVGQLKLKGGSRCRHFWLDTLCVPPDRQGKDRQQSLAMDKMYETYANAEFVLVLEDYLMHQQMTNVPEPELLMHTVRSPWNRRLWTFQEASLAGTNDLLFQFMDGVCNADAILLNHLEKKAQARPSKRIRKGKQWYKISRAWRKLEDRHRSPLNLDVFRLYCELRIGLDLVIGTQKKMSGSLFPICAFWIPLWKTLRFRSTSRHGDEALCLANLLKLNTQVITRLKGNDKDADILEKKWKAFWEQIEKVPSQILLLAAPRLKARGYQWAPSTFLDAHDVSQVDPRVTILEPLTQATPAADGLCLRSWGFSFRIPVDERGFPATPLWVLNIPQSEHLVMVRLFEDTSWRAAYMIPTGNHISEPIRTATITTGMLPAEMRVNPVHTMQGSSNGTRLFYFVAVRHDNMNQVCSAPQSGEAQEMRGVLACSHTHEEVTSDFTLPRNVHRLATLSLKSANPSRLGPGNTQAYRELLADKNLDWSGSAEFGSTRLLFVRGKAWEEDHEWCVD